MSDLRKLIEAVETGTISDDPREPDEFAAFDTDGIAFSEYGIEAYLGSLDAAKSLHEALLPGWDWYRWPQGDFEVRLGYSTGFGGASPTPARAWLIAILKAYDAI